MTVSPAMFGILGGASVATSILWSSDGSSLTGWTVSGVTVDSTLGNPAPSFRAYPTNTYAYIAPAGISDLIGKSIKFDCKLGSSTPLANLFFGCNSSGAGRMLRIEGRSGNNCGIATTTGWTSWSAPANTFAPVTDGAWHTYKIDIKAGPVVDVWLDNVKVLSNVSIALSGTYIGLSGDAGSSGGNFDNLSIFNT